jgi:hypothetical protein
MIQFEHRSATTGLIARKVAATTGNAIEVARLVGGQTCSVWIFSVRSVELVQDPESLRLRRRDCYGRKKKHNRQRQPRPDR